ncbi:MAG: hypothetical protein ACLGH8_05665 [Bacteroidia bacterium]
MKHYTNIPVSLCEFALVNRKINQLKLYVYLKLNSDGYIEFNHQRLAIWAYELGISIRTAKTAIEWLINNKWLTVNGKRNSLHIISYKNLGRKLHLQFGTGVILDITNQIDYKHFKSFCCASVITFYLNKKRYFNKQSAINKGIAKTNCKRINGFYPMANSYLAKCINVSTTTAYRIKKDAEVSGFITTKSEFSHIETKSGRKVDKYSYETIWYSIVKEGLPNRLRRGKKYLLQVESDLIRSVLKLKAKRL